MNDYNSTNRSVLNKVTGKSITDLVTYCVHCVVALIKDFFGGLLSFFRVELKELLNPKVFFRDVVALKNRTVLVASSNVFKRKCFISVFFVILLNVLCALIATKNESHNVYLSTFFTLFAVCMFFVAFSLIMNPIQNSTMFYTLSTCFLIAIGVLLQIMIANSYKDESSLDEAIVSIIMTMLSGLAVALVLTYLLIKVFRSPNTKAYASVFVLLIVVFLVMAFALRLLLAKVTIGENEEVPAWYPFANRFRFVIGEVIKLLFVSAIVLIHNIKGFSQKKILTYVSILSIFVFCAFVLINEFGIGIMSLLAFLLMVFVSMKSKKRLIGCLIILLVILITGVSVAKVCYDYVYSGPQSEILVDLNQKAVECKKVGDTAGEAENLTKASTQKVLADNEIKERNKGIVKIFASGYQKFLGRSNQTEDQYHANQIKSALYSTKLFGTEQRKIVYVSNQHNDSIFSYALMQLGLIPVMLIMVLYMGLFLVVVIKAGWLCDNKYSLALIGFAVFISIQSVIQLSMALSVFPIVGLTTTYLSSGGSAAAINYVMAFVSLYFMRINLTDRRNHIEE